jgi:hypothetical protein
MRPFSQVSIRHEFGVVFSFVTPESLPTTQILIRDINPNSRTRFRRWLLDKQESSSGPGDHNGHKGHNWLAVMCLTGVDYFSTLGYQPAIAALAAGLLSPFATIVLVLLTLFGALPVYRKVAGKSYRGEGSIAIMEHLLPWWMGKLFVLVMLGFAATDFIITITLSAADATAHIIYNPFTPAITDGAVPITLILIGILGAVFLAGFREAIGVAVALVASYLALNVVVIVTGIMHVASNQVVISDWWQALLQQNGSPIMMVAVSLLVFPKLALGMSGFETGVAVMPQIRGEADDPSIIPQRRIAGARKLLTTAALTMSVLLITSSFVTTLLIPQAEFQPGGQANGRALAFLAHEYLGATFGTIYDISTILILWFAGASAMAGLLNLVPRYLPRYGMAPQWAALSRPLVIAFTSIAFIITIIFQANVDDQAGAYATGVLVLMTSAALSAALLARRAKQRWQVIAFSIITAVFVYTTAVNIIERPDGVRIATVFIVGIILISLISRVRRSFQVRARTVTFDSAAMDFLSTDAEGDGGIVLIAHEPQALVTDDNYRAKAREERNFNNMPANAPVLFIEVQVTDSSEFQEDLTVRGVTHAGYRVLEVASSSVPNALAAVLLGIRDEFGVVPSIYFDWSEGNPVGNMLKFLVTGNGEVAAVTREVLRQSEPDVNRRPLTHVS